MVSAKSVQIIVEFLLTEKNVLKFNALEMKLSQLMVSVPHVHLTHLLIQKEKNANKQSAKKQKF